jgi:anaerobic glycerol-3-phosphate dehydrogenase
LNDFGDKKWKLLYHGSDDGFGASNFHSKCDGIGNTVTVILTTIGCILGGFTPVAWDSKGAFTPDSTNQSFLFRIKDSRNSARLKFTLSNSSYAILCQASYGPRFANACNISVADCCNQDANSSTKLGTVYANVTGLDDTQIFTAKGNFTLKRIEVFTITK